ncbi:hypothetical protein BpHYR1_008154 [Brachionus plicatilis]|uniref:Uncharacterized protein n=1 Tax=Brachionus plicatilis TaxID=10195 RepID=A0A3M7PRH5_BRAPC|nr:hypothetical protein BpHYR1_008154 [Brachionus plicatilis]
MGLNKKHNFMKIGFVFMTLYIAIATGREFDDKSLKSKEFFRLKFVTPYTEFPVRLKDNFGYLRNTKWFKYGSDCFVDQLDYFKDYFTFEDQNTQSSNPSLNLLITDFNNQSFALLDHYEPRHEQVDRNFLDFDREIYSIVYLNKFYPHIVDKDDKIELSCVATFVYPADLADQHAEILMEELFNSVQITLKIHDNFRQKRFIKNTSYQVKRSANVQTVHEIDFTEGPITFYKETFEKLTTSCGIKILDYDGTYALNHIVTKLSLEIHSSRVNRETKSNFLLKWVITEPNLPLLFGVPRRHNTDYRWYKHSENNYVDELETYGTEFLYSNTANESFLYLLSYDTKIHDHLSSFEPIPVGVSQFQRYYFTTIYLESHLIDTIETEDNFNVFCNLTLMLPKYNDTINKENMRLIEDYLRVRIGLIDNLNEQKLNIKTAVPRHKRDSSKLVFLRVELDIGPIVLPKTNIFDKDSIKNNNISCRLDLFETSPVEGRNLISRSLLFKPIDTFVPNYKKEEEKSPVVEKTTTKKIFRNSQNSIFFSRNVAFVSAVPVLLFILL